MASAAPTDNRVYLYRLLTLNIDYGTAVVRNIIDDKCSNTRLPAFLTKHRRAIINLRAKRLITKVQFDLLYPQSGVPPTTADFDLTLAICLLRNLQFFGLNSTFTWNFPPQSGDTSLEADMCRLRIYRNELAHISSTTGISETDFKTKWADIEGALHRLNGLVLHPIQNLQQIIDDCKTGPLDPEAEKEIEIQIEAMQKIEEKLEMEVQNIKKEISDVKTDLQMAKDDVIKVKGEVQEATKGFKKMKNDVEGDINKVEKEVQEVKGDFHKLSEHFNSTQKRMDEQEKQRDTRHYLQTVENAYIRQKERLKNDLVALYKSRYSTIPLSPLFDKHDTPLVDFYVLPKMNFIEKRVDEEIKTPVKSLSDILKSENSQEIYLTADAGFGKTAFSKHLTVTWCQAHRHEEKFKEYFSEDEINTLGDFEFVFLLLLRDSSDDCSIDDLIFNQIMPNLSRSSAMTIDSLQEVMHREKCLVILDGLDEWTHPEKKCTKVPKTIPHRNAREKCVILTTTRPWKLGILNLKTSEVNKKVELVKLTSESALTLEGRAISKIKKIDIAEAKIRAKQLQLKIKTNKLEYLESVPLLAMYLICLWCDDIPLGQSKCGLYASITELLLKRTISKHPEMKQMCDPYQSDITQLFSEHENCTQYGTYLNTLGKLAFGTLFGKINERTLVFNKSVAEKYLSGNYLKLSFDSGLLTQSTEESLTKQICKVSFAHKTVHEFFCALYICCQNESGVKNNILYKCKSLENILDMSAVFVFISGMNAEIMSCLSYELMSVINEDKTTRKCRWSKTDECDPLKEIQRMLISCMNENTRGDVHHLYCQDFFFDGDCKEDRYFSYLARLIENNKNTMQSINIDTRYGCRSLREIIDSSGLHEYFNVNKIFYYGRDEEAQLPMLLNKSPKCLVVRSSGPCVGSWSREMWETLQNNSLLQTISIRRFNMSHDLLKNFLEYLMNTKTFTEIELELLSCTEHGDLCCVQLDFSKHSVLRKLELWEIPVVSLLYVNSQVKRIELSGINLSLRALSHEMINLEYVKLKFVKMSASTFRDLVKVVEKLSHKVKVKIGGCEIEPETEFEHIKQYVHTSQNLRVTRDSWRQFVFETNV